MYVSTFFENYGLEETLQVVSNSKQNYTQSLVLIKTSHTHKKSYIHKRAFGPHIFLSQHFKSRALLYNSRVSQKQLASLTCSHVPNAPPPNCGNPRQEPNLSKKKTADRLEGRNKARTTPNKKEN